MNSHPRRVFRIALLTVALIGCSRQADGTQIPDAATISSAMEKLADEASLGVAHIVAIGASNPRRGGVAATSAQSVGSGVVLSEDGWILTNAHVVFGAEKIFVTVFQDAEGQGKAKKPVRKRLVAQLVAVDLDSDLAVLKLSTQGLFPLSLAPGEAQPGQLALAFGSPLGLEGTVSMGIVSAVDRRAQDASPIVYLQTDASINPGNSGGPLVNARGQVIGINTFIMSTTGGSQGLGFALPSGIARSVFEQARATGRVHHGTLAAHVVSVTPTVASDLGLTRSTGALIADLAPQGPAAAAGLEVGDVIVGLGDNEIQTAREFNARIHTTAPGDVVRIEYYRDGSASETRAKVTARPGDPTELLGGLELAKQSVDALDMVGMTLTESARAVVGQTRSEEGVLVLDAGPDVDGRGLEQGDIVVAVGRTATPTLDALRKALSRYGPHAEVVLRIERGGMFDFLVQTLRE